MNSRARASFRILRLTLGLGLALSAAGCETLENLNPFQEKETPLPGTRQQVFPEGVPGVDYAAKPAQPTNANATLDTLPAAQGNTGKPAGN